MTGRKLSSRERLLILAALAVLLGGSAYDFGAFSSRGTPAASTTGVPSRTTTVSSETVTGTPGSVPGLELLLDANATTLSVGQSLNVGVSLYNTLPAVDYVPASKDRSFQGVLLSFWGDCVFDPPLRAVVLEGNYSLEQLRSIANITVSYACAEASSVEQLTFEPESTLANATMNAMGTNETFAPQNMSVDFTAGGYWSLPSISSQFSSPWICPVCGSAISPAETPFTPGVYTVAVAGEWGDAAVLHFIVDG
jgi:hypothetical protein